MASPNPLDVLGRLQGTETDMVWTTAPFLKGGGK